MSFLKSRHSQASGLDLLFEKGVSGVERMPQKTLSDKQIQAAAIDSKAGAGIWVKSHTKEILIVAIFLFVGAVASIPFWHSASLQPIHTQTSTSQADTHSAHTDTNTNLKANQDICHHGQNVRTAKNSSHTVPVQHSSPSVTELTLNSQSQQAITQTSDFIPSDSPVAPVVVEQTDIQGEASHKYDMQVEHITPNVPESMEQPDQPQTVDSNQPDYSTEIQTISGSDTMDNESPEPEPQDPNETIKPKVRERKPLSSPFDGFHVGCLMDAGVMSPAKLTSTTYLRSEPGAGGRVGLELSYHFNKYFGVSAGMDYGTSGAFRYHAHGDTGNVVPFDMKDYAFYRLGISVPVKFEFHAPISSKVWLTMAAGMRLRVPWGTIFYRNIGTLNSTTLHGITEESYPQLNIKPSVLDPNRFNVDALANVGFYFQLGKSDFLRWTIGVSCPFQDFSSGSYSLCMETITVDSMPSPTYSYENGTYRLRSNMFYMQIGYIHTFGKRKQ